jgi:enamine deaminase RidA (YjgF/YER057c/UK114 family)
MLIERINPSALSKPTGYTHVVTATGGRMIYISGQVAFDKEGNVVGANDFRAQAVQVFENLRAALTTTGADFANVVKPNYYVLDMANPPTLREIRSVYLKSEPPASTLVEVKKLAHEQFMLEIEAMPLCNESTCRPPLFLRMNEVLDRYMIA